MVGEVRKKQKLSHVMDAFVLGAILLIHIMWWLVAMLATSNEVREAFRIKYGKSILIQKIRRPPAITTTSALGRSSMYNRLKYGDRLLYQKVGYTKGFGEFHFQMDCIIKYMSL